MPLSCKFRVKLHQFKKANKQALKGGNAGWFSFPSEVEVKARSLTGAASVESLVSFEASVRVPYSGVPQFSSCLREI